MDPLNQYTNMDTGSLFFCLSPIDEFVELYQVQTLNLTEIVTFRKSPTPTFMKAAKLGL